MRVRTLFFAVLLIPAILSASNAPSLAAHAAKAAKATKRTKAAKAVVKVAPADEYFGRLKMSILGIRNQLRDLTLRLQYAPDRSADVLGTASFVEDALHDWEHKYPADPWLAKSVYDLTNLYASVHSAMGHADAVRAFNWLQYRYPRTSYAVQARTELAAVLK